MKPINGFSVSSLQAATHQVLVLKLEGATNTLGGTRWLQIHDSVAAPAAGAVPLKQYPATASAEFYKEFKRGDLTCFLGCWVGLSTTDGTYTASTDTMDVSVELSDPDRLAGSTFIGDLTSAVIGVQVWTEASGAGQKKKLLGIEVDGTNLTTATQFIMIFATNSVATGDAPLLNMCFPIAVGQVRTGSDGLRFGETCRDMSSYDGTTWHYGCRVMISSTPKTYTAPNGTACIRAEYIAG